MKRMLIVGVVALPLFSCRKRDERVHGSGSGSASTSGSGISYDDLAATLKTEKIVRCSERRPSSPVYLPPKTPVDSISRNQHTIGSVIQSEALSSNTILNVWGLRVKKGGKPDGYYDLLACIDSESGIEPVEVLLDAKDSSLPYRELRFKAWRPSQTALKQTLAIGDESKPLTLTPTAKSIDASITLIENSNNETSGSGSGSEGVP